MHVLVLGGTPEHQGGLEAVCDRSIQALSRQTDWRFSRLFSNTAFLSVRRLPVFLDSLLQLVRFRTQRPDCVWLHYVNLPDLVFLVAAKALGLRVLVTPHLGTNWRSQTNRMLRRLSCLLLSASDRIILLAKTQEQELPLPRTVPRSYVRSFLPAIILGSDTTRRETTPHLRLLHAARLSVGKGTFDFIKVCEKLKTAGVPFSALIAGGADDSTVSKVRDTINACDLANEIQFLGRKSDDEMRSLLLSSDVLVHLSRIDSYPLTVLEALACGVLPICIGLAGARDMITTYNGHLVSADTPVSDATDFLLQHSPAEIRSMAAAATTRVRTDYDWVNCALLIEQALLTSVPQPRHATASA
jgi:glycosyltransferase involved in cell wall biosynthesis